MISAVLMKLDVFVQKLDDGARKMSRVEVILTEDWD